MADGDHTARIPRQFEADLYERRHEAVRALAQGALLEFPALQAWGLQKKNRMDFSLPGITPIPEAGARHFVHFDGLAHALAAWYIGALHDPEQVRQLAALERYRDISVPNHHARAIEGIGRDIEQRILAAVFDGELVLYTNPLMQEIDITAARLRHERQAWPVSGNHGGAAGPQTPDTPDSTRAGSHTGSSRTGLVIGSNSRDVLAAHCALRLRELYAADTTRTRTQIAQIIAAELKDGGHRGEKGDYLSAGTINRILPPGLTGGRTRNGIKKA